jgi:hypothetical protein
LFRIRKDRAFPPIPFAALLPFGDRWARVFPPSGFAIAGGIEL